MVTRCALTEHDFHEQFASAEDCLSAAMEQGICRIEEALCVAVSDKQGWLVRVRAALSSALRFLDSEPQWARLLVIESPTLGQRALELREQSFQRLAEALDGGAPQPQAAGPALGRELLAELVVGGVIAVIQRRMLEDGSEPLTELAPSLMSMIALSYLGAEAATAELSRQPTPRSQVRSQAKGLPARATYRTALVLGAIDASPYSSNRDVAAAAGLGDEGQTSRLLARLRRQGLIENVGLGAARGESNAWLLTTDGKRMAGLLSREFAVEASHAPMSAPRQGRVTCQG